MASKGRELKSRDNQLVRNSMEIFLVNRRLWSGCVRAGKQMEDFQQDLGCYQRIETFNLYFAKNDQTLAPFPLPFALYRLPTLAQPLC